MLNSRLLAPALLCTLACSCASSPAGPARASLPEGAQAIELEPALAGEAPPRHPYAPKRASDAPHYSWQSAAQQGCPSASLAKNAQPASRTLKFDGSVGVFPALTANEVIVLAELDASGESGARRSLVAPPAAVTAPPPSSAHRPVTPDSVVAAMRPAFRQCFSHWLDEKADAEGSVRLALELGCAGTVQAISADANGVDEPTVGCLFTVVGPAQFEPPAGGHATIQVPVVFKNANR